MSQDHLEVSGVFPASPEAIYDAFLDGSKHTAMTGAPATASSEVGGRFSAWDGYIEGENVQLDRPRRILQRWRASDFPDGAPASLLEISFDSEGSGTRVLIRHAELPEGTAGRFTEGWTKFYFAPMSVYFGETPSAADDEEEVELADDEAAEVVDEDDEEAVSADDATARRDTGSAPVVDTSESLRDAARAEDEDDAEESSQREDVDGAIRSLWEAAATGDVEASSDDAGAVRVSPTDSRNDEDEEDDEDEDEDEPAEFDAELRTPTMRAPAHADWAPGHEPTGIKALASRALRGLKKLVGVNTHDEDETETETIDVGAPIPSPSQLASKGRPAAEKKAAPKKTAAKKASPKKKAAPKKAAAKKAAPKKAAAKKAAPKKAAKKAAAKKAAPKKASAKKAAPKKSAKKAAPKKSAKKAAPKKAAAKKAAAPKKAAAKKAAPKKAAAKLKRSAPKKKAAAKKKAKR